VCVYGAVGSVCLQISIFFTTRSILLILYNLYVNMLRLECGDETGTLLKVDQKQLESLKYGAGVGWNR
jgi:hypothetical protein